MTVLATAGHVDHGKSTLVSFLTGQETDRLVEEKRRGLTINLGYTSYEFKNQTTSIVDVPGHRDFFKNTVAGFSNADAILFVIDSTQGWSEQSEQHFKALVGLSKLNIIFVFTKLDLVESDVSQESLIEKVSSIKNLNYTILEFDKNSTIKEDLIGSIQSFLTTCTNTDSSFWVDRSFIIDGIGRIITGTAGTNFKTDNLILASNSEKLEVRSIESVNENYIQLPSSQRIAFSLKKTSGVVPKRGDLISNEALVASDHLLIEITSKQANQIKKNTTKLFVGTTNRLVEKLHLLEIGEKMFAVVKLNESLALPKQEKIVLHDIDNNDFYACIFVIPIVNKYLMKHLIRESKNKKTFIRDKLGFKKNEIVIGSFQKDGVGWGEGILPKNIKGPDLFVHSIEIIAKTLPIVVLLTGPSRGYIKNELTKRNIKFKHVYLKNYEEIVDYYHALDLYIVSSREEGGPKPLIESMASGVPVVTTNVGMAKDFIKDNINGGIVESFNPKDIAKKSIEILNLPKELLISNARKDVMKADWDVVAKLHWENVYKPALDSLKH